MNIRLNTTILSLTLLVLAAACGGGGGGGGTAATPTTMPPTNMPPPTTGDPNTGNPNTPSPVTFMPATLPGYAIPNLTTAQMLVSGTAPAMNMAEAQIVTGIQTRATAADSFEFSDFSGATGTSTVSLTRSGDGRSYTGDVPAVGEITFSLDGIADLSLVDETNFNFDTQAVMDEGGATMVQSRVAAEQSDGTQLTFKSYGGWLDNSVFGLVFLDVTESATTTNRFASFSFGKEADSRPTGDNLLRWTGVMVGSTATGDILQGDLVVTYATADVSILDQVQFLDVKNLNDGNDVSFRSSNGLVFNNIRLEMDGSFESASGDIKGSFYGDNGAQIGGVFNRSDHNVIGAFGGVKQ